MKIACTGSTGRVGQLLVKNYGVVPLVADITNSSQVERELDTVKPHVLIHLAGISNVDYCEVPAHWEEVMAVNFSGSVNVLRACNDRSILTGYLSSEHVYSGRSFLWWGGGPYKESQIPSKNVVNAYALTKRAVEGLHYAFPVMRIVRTSYLFDYPRLITEELNKDREEKGRYAFPTFLHRSYMYLPHFVKNLMIYAENIANMPTVLHLAGSKTITQYQFMSEFAKEFNLPHTIVSRREPKSYGAERPRKAGLDTKLSASLGFPQYSYRDGFASIHKDYVRG